MLISILLRVERLNDCSSKVKFLPFKTRWSILALLNESLPSKISPATIFKSPITAFSKLQLNVNELESSSSLSDSGLDSGSSSVSLLNKKLIIFVSEKQWDSVFDGFNH